MKVTHSPSVWRATAHPVRRRLIEMLGGGPRTTGDLARGFPVSRFAVMKHLRILERSGIISVDRRGRESWNVLTIGGSLELSVTASGQPVAALGPGSGQAATVPAVGQGSGDAVTVPAVGHGFPGLSGVEGNPAQAPGGLFPFHIEQSVLLAAPASRVFDALTFNVSAWWGAPYLRSSSATNVVLEPQLGGRLFEEWGHRQGYLRGVVTAIRQDERLEVAGRIAGTGCVPAVLAFAVRQSERGTRLSLSHRGLVEPNPDGPADVRALYDRAWAELVGERLRAFVERGIRSGVVERPAPEGALLGWF